MFVFAEKYEVMVRKSTDAINNQRNNIWREWKVYLMKQ